MDIGHTVATSTDVSNSNIYDKTLTSIIFDGIYFPSINQNLPLFLKQIKMIFEQNYATDINNDSNPDVFAQS